MTSVQQVGPTTQEIVWTVLPNGVAADGRCRLSVMASPRLSTSEQPPQLDEFDFVDWPAAVNAVTFGVFVDGNGLPDVERESEPADSKLWAELFPPTTLVQPFTFRDYSKRKIRSYPVWSVMSYLSTLYRTTAVTFADDLPPVAGNPPYADLFSDVGETLGHFRLPHGRRARQRLEGERDRTALWGSKVEQEWQKWRGQPENRELAYELALVEFQRWYSARRRFHALDDAFGSETALGTNVDFAALGFASKAAMDCYQAHRFFDRPELTSEDEVHPPEVPQLDFHQALGALGDYPVLLRRLGLVVDLLVQIPASPAVRMIRVLPESPKGFRPFNHHRLPQTRFQRDAATFFAAPDTATEIRNGALHLAGVNDHVEQPGTHHLFTLLQVDPDGSALKLVNMASEMRSLLADRDNGRAGFDTPERAGLPSLRSAGINLVRHNRAAVLADRLQGEASRNSTNLDDVVHSAEHLLRGYRVDIQDLQDGRWYSLCRRKGSYSITPDSGGMVEVTPPGQPIVDEGYVKATSSTSSDALDSDLYLHEALVRWDGWSLVAPRPGRTIEAVTAADGTQQETVKKPDTKPATAFKLNATFQAEEHSLPRLRFGKSYAMRVRTVDLAGNSVTLDQAAQDPQVVSDPVLYTRWEPISPPAIVPRAAMREGEAVERMVIRSDYDRSTAVYTQANQAFGYLAENDRHLVPPKTSQQMAETHGAFDVAFGPGARPADAYAVAVRESATLERDHNGNLLSGSVTVEGQYPPDTIVEPDPVTGQPPAAPGSYLVNSDLKFPLAYLPDFAAGGVTFRGLPGDPLLHRREFELGWPGRQPFVLRVAELPGVIQSGQCSETASNASPLEWHAGDRVLTVRLGKGEVRVVRYSCHPAPEMLQLMAVWQRWIKGTPEEAKLTELAKSGGHWMISPFRELVLVHAVARPLCAPSLRLRSSRLKGETFARIDGRAFLSVKSTGYVDLHGAWTDQVDSLSDLAPKPLDGRAHVTARRVEKWLPEQEPFPAATPGDDKTILVPDSGGVLFPFPDEDGEWGADIRHEFGDTKHRWVDYRLTGTTRFREYFSPDITSDPEKITRTGEPVRVNVWSSARPDAPRLLYVVPSFRWRPDNPPPLTWTSFSRTRVGGGLRVWMQRPWFSSGVDELLGVVLWPGADDKLSAEMSKFVSQMGQDRVSKSAVPQTKLTADQFSNRVTFEDGLSLEELPDGPKVNVVGFTPQYDNDRQLWFCDIDLNLKAGPSYFPFVRLALARYQPHSVPGLELSRVVQADFAQLLPSRTLALAFGRGNVLNVTVSGNAPELLANAVNTRVEAVLEDHGAMPGDLGWVAVGKTLQLTQSADPNKWTGTFKLGEYPARTQGKPPRRVVVRELERYNHEYDSDGKMVPADRVVYADVVELP